MNIENVKKWVAALRSGKYKQCRNLLYDGVGYCCLGVVCDLAGIIPEKIETSKGYYYQFDGSTTKLPIAAQKWLGTDQQSPHIGETTAIALNDVDLRSFNRIADEIEKHWLNGTSIDQS